MYQRDGAMQVGTNQGKIDRSTYQEICKFFDLGGSPNYYRNTYHGPDVTNRDKHIEHATFESGMAARHEANDDDNFSQPRIFYQVNKSI
jgi:catalase